MNANIPTEVISLFRRLFPAFQGQVTGWLTAADVEGWDSLRHAELIFGIEDALDVTIDPASAFDAPDLGSLLASAVPRAGLS